MKRKLFMLWIVLASVDFCLLISPANFTSLSISFVVGIIIGLLINKICSNYHFRDNPIVSIGCVIVDICIIWKCSSIFSNTWSQSGKINEILETLTSNTALLLRIIGFVFALFALPFIHIIISTIVRIIIKVVKTVNWKKLWKIKHISWKSFLKASVTYLLNIIIAAFFGLLLLIAIFKLPLGNIISNVEKSAVVMNNEGSYPIVYSWCTSTLDNYTDSIMLTEASNNTTESPLNKALMVYRGTIEDKDPQEVLVEHFIDGTEFTDIESYARYWHGYHIFLKPLLEIMDYSTIRIVNGIIQIVLLLIICWLMIKKNLKHFVFPYIICYLLLMPIALAMSLQFSSCYYIISVGMLLLLLLPDSKRIRYSWVVFLNIGILTAFFDFLTYPIATFGVPAVLFIALSMQDETELKLLCTIKDGIAWCFGFGGMWVSKWILTALFTDYDIFENAFSAFSMRVSNTAEDGETEYSVLNCIFKNYQRLFSTPFTILIIVFIIFLIIYIRKNSGFDSTIIRIMIPYIILSFAPMVWFCFATNHSMIHSAFTNKSCIVSVIAIMFGLVECYVYIKKKSFDKRDMVNYG